MPARGEVSNVEANMSIASGRRFVVHAADYEESPRMPDLEARYTYDDQSDSAQR